MYCLNRKGSILVSVLVVVFVLTILGIALGSVALGDQRQTARQQGNNEAYYVARGGAEAVAAYLLENPEAAGELIAKGQDEVVLENGVKFVVQVTELSGGGLRIESTGHSGKYSEEVALSLEYSPSKAYVPQNPILDMAVFGEGSLNLNGKVEGSIATNSTNPGSINLAPQANVTGNVCGGLGGDMGQILSNRGEIHGEIRTLDAVRNYPLPVFPVFPDLPYRNNLNVSGLAPTVSESGRYGTISIASELKFATGGPEEKIEIVAKKLELGNSAKITLLGEGTLVLYIEDTFDLKNNAVVNPGNNPDPNRVIVYYKGTNEIKNKNSSTLFGCMYAEKADIDVSNGGDIAGSIFSGGGKVDLKNSSYVRVVYAPNASVILHNSGNVEGAIVCKEFESKNKGVVRYNAAINGIWGIIPDILFDPMEVESPGYLKGFWSN